MAKDSSAGPNEVGGTPCASRVFERIARSPLRRVHPNTHCVIRHARSHKAHRRLHRFGSGFASELPIGGLGVRHCANRFGDHSGCRLDRVGMRFGSDPHGTNALWIDLCAHERVARRFDAHRRHIFIESGAFL